MSQKQRNMSRKRNGSHELNVLLRNHGITRFMLSEFSFSELGGNGDTLFYTSWCTGIANFGFILLFACDICLPPENIIRISVQYSLYTS